MAEMLGIVAGGMGVASLAIQIEDSVMKLKDFWNAVKEAPEEVKYLIEEIETLSLVLSEIRANGDDDDKTRVSSVSLKMCLDLCQRGAEILGTVVREAEQEIVKKRRIGSLKMVLKKGLVDKLRDRLKTVQLMLMLSNQTYLEALQKHRHQLQRQWAELHQQEMDEVKLTLSKTIARVSFTREDSPEARKGNQILSVSVGKSQRQQSDLERDLQLVDYAAVRHRKRMIARLRTPAWLSFSRSAWEICMYRATAGWMFTAQTYRVVPVDAPIMEFAESGDLRAIQALFEKKLASPYDREVDGCTVLDRAALYQQVEVCHFLLNQGADPNASIFRYSGVCTDGVGDKVTLHSSALIGANTGWKFGIKHDDPGAHRKLVRCIGQRLDEGFIDTSSTVTSYSGSTEGLECLLHDSYALGRPRTPQESFKIVEGIVSYSYHSNIASLIRVILGRGQINPMMATLNDHYGSTLLHYAAEYLGRHHTISVWRHCMQELQKKRAHSLRHLDSYDVYDPYLRQWNQFEHDQDLILITDLVLGSANLSKRNLGHRTPLLEICSGVVEEMPGLSIYHPFFPLLSSLQRKAGQSLELPIRAWLHQLTKAGVDLTEYGRGESRLHREHRVRKQWDFIIEDPSSAEYVKIFTLRMISFTYGPSPGDWHFWFTEPMDNTFLDFWHMVDHPEQGMPGAWNRYDGGDVDNSWLEDSEDDSSDCGSNEYSDNIGHESDSENEGEGVDCDGGGVAYRNGNGDVNGNGNDKHDDNTTLSMPEIAATMAQIGLNGV